MPPRSGSGTRRSCFRPRSRASGFMPRSTSVSSVRRCCSGGRCSTRGAVRSYGASVLYIFTTAVHTSILGALLTFATRVWYPAYAARPRAWGLTPLEDQQIGGLDHVGSGGSGLSGGGSRRCSRLWLRESDVIVRRARVCAISALSRARTGRPVCVALELQRSAAARRHVTGGRCRSAAQPPSSGTAAARATPFRGYSGAHGLVGPSLAGIRQPRLRGRHAAEHPAEPGCAGSAIRKQSTRKPVMPNLGVTQPGRRRYRRVSVFMQ